MGAVAFVDPGFQLGEGRDVGLRGSEGDLAGLAEAVGGGLGVRALQRLRARVGELDAEAERPARRREVGEGLVPDGEVVVLGPRRLIVRAGVGEAEGAKGGDEGVGGYSS